MKNLKLFVLPLLVLMPLTSCSGIDDEHSIVPMINYDSYKNSTGRETYYEIDSEKLYNLLDNKYSFALEIYRNGCSLCETFDPILNDYIKNNHYQMYRLGLNTSSEISAFSSLINDFPNVFNDFEGTPSFYYIKEGELTYSVSPNKFTSYTAFSKIADKHFYSSSMYSVSTLQGLEYYLKDFSNSFIYMMDPTSIVSSEVFVQIHNQMKSSSRTALILDSEAIDAENYQQICDNLGVSITDHFAICYNETGVKKYVNYLIDDASFLKSWLTTYLV